MRIGDAAARVGVDTHVLRHWEDMGVLVPRRSETGQRVYDEEGVRRALLIRKCQRAGLTLAQIRDLGRASRPEQRSLVGAHRSRIAAAIEQLRDIDRFLEHVLSCRHPLVSECPQCSAFATTPPASLDA
jgi:DNA-binding transcriptional MerR regulator